MVCAGSLSLMIQEMINNVAFERAESRRASCKYSSEPFPLAAKYSDLKIRKGVQPLLLASYRAIIQTNLPTPPSRSPTFLIPAFIWRRCCCNGRLTTWICFSLCGRMR